MNDTKEKHATSTPGPWHAYQSRKDVYRNIASHDGSKIAKEVHHANARLIAAAPDMYEMLKELENGIHLARARKGSKTIYKLREVLAKVEGGEG